MKVYVVEYFDYEASYVAGVFLSEQGAKDAIEKYEKQDKEDGVSMSYCYGAYDVQD